MIGACADENGAQRKLLLAFVRTLLSCLGILFGYSIYHNSVFHFVNAKGEEDKMASSLQIPTGMLI